MVPELSLDSVEHKEGNTGEETPVFGIHAAKLRRAGLCVLPADGKSPLRNGFSEWPAAPAIKTVEGWAEKTPYANIVFIPGLSRTADGCEIITLDCDDFEMSEYVDRTFGRTSAKTRTRKGRHHHFKMPAGIDLDALHSLRHLGLNIDVKHGQRQAGIVVAPPSRHPDDKSFVYQWEGCDETAFRDPPPFDVAKLRDIIETRSAVAARSASLRDVTRPPPRAPGAMRDGSRGQWLNDCLCSEAPWCESLDEVIDCARTLNDDLADRGCELLPEAEVVERAKSVWRDVQCGKLARMHRERRAVRTSGKEIEQLLQGFKNGSDALALLNKLRAEHGARLDRGEAFRFVVASMVAARTMGPWAARRYRAARDTLIEAGLLIQTSPSNWRAAATYTLTTIRR